MNCGGENLKYFLEKSGKNATYTFKDAAVDVVETIGWWKMDYLMVSNIIEMGFDGVATFSGRHKRVQALINKNLPHLIFVHCHCHLLQLACVEAANSTAPFGTASVEKSFSWMKMIKTQLRNRLGEKSLSYLIKLSIELPQKLNDEDLETLIEIWNRKTRIAI